MAKLIKFSLSLTKIDPPLVVFVLEVSFSDMLEADSSLSMIVLFGCCGSSRLVGLAGSSYSELDGG